MPYTLVGMRLYSMRGTVIFLVTVPIIKGVERFGGNFHNCHGSYSIWFCIPQRFGLTSIRLTLGGNLSRLRLKHA